MSRGVLTSSIQLSWRAKFPHSHRRPETSWRIAQRSVVCGSVWEPGRAKACGFAYDRQARKLLKGLKALEQQAGRPWETTGTGARPSPPHPSRQRQLGRPLCACSATSPRATTAWSPPCPPGARRPLGVRTTSRDAMAGRRRCRCRHPPPAATAERRHTHARALLAAGRAQRCCASTCALGAWSWRMTAAQRAPMKQRCLRLLPAAATPPPAVARWRRLHMAGLEGAQLYCAIGVHKRPSAVLPCCNALPVYCRAKRWTTWPTEGLKWLSGATPCWATQPRAPPRGCCLPRE